MMDYVRAAMLLCIVALQIAQDVLCLPQADPETRARMEAQAMSQISLKHLEEMVEQDERVRNVHTPPLIIIPKPKDLAAEADPHYSSKAYIIHKKPKKALLKKHLQAKPELKAEQEGGLLDFEPPMYRFDGIKYDDDVPSWFESPELESAASSPPFGFYESIAERILGNEKGNFGDEDPFAALEIASSDATPRYESRFDYDAYSKDPTETKLSGKSYWRDSPERREEKIDDKGCRMVVKKIMDPEDEKKSAGGAVPKSVIITKECEYPSIEGPDAKIPDMQYRFRSGPSRLDREPSRDSYDSSEPADEEKSDSGLSGESVPRKPLESDYIDRMLESHFKSFPSFSNPITSFQGYQDRFNLRTPDRFRQIKPTVGVQSYEYSHPKSGFESDDSSETKKSDAPRTYDHHYHYDYPAKSGQKESVPSSAKKDDAPRTYEHHHHYDHPAKSEKSAASGFDDDADDKSSNKKDPKMMKKSFAYYRKDNPKDDPNDHQYAEEYAQGNYRSFSTDYDSERDGPKKKQ